MSYVLVFWEEPPSSSIVHKSKVIGGVVIGAKRDIVWGRQQLRATILRAGTMPVLKAIVVTTDGEVADPTRGPAGEVAQRRRDLLDERQRQAVQHRTAAEAARSHFLYTMTDDAVPVPGHRVEWLPPGGASPEELLRNVPVPLTRENVQLILDELPCLRKPPPGDDQMLNLGGAVYPVYLEKRAVWSAVKQHKFQPDTLYRELLFLCVPPTVLALPFVTSGGTKNTVAVPPNVTKGLAYFVGAKTDGVIKNPAKSNLNAIRDVRANPTVRAALEKVLRRHIAQGAAARVAPGVAQVPAAVTEAEAAPHAGQAPPAPALPAPVAVGHAGLIPIQYTDVLPPGPAQPVATYIRDAMAVLNQ